MPTYLLTQYPTDPPEVELIFPLAVPEGLDAVHTGVCIALKRLRPLRRIDHESVNSGERESVGRGRGLRITLASIRAFQQRHLNETD